MADETEAPTNGTNNEAMEYLLALEKKLTNHEIAEVGLWLEYRVRLLPTVGPDGEAEALAVQAERRLTAIQATHQECKRKIMERFQP